MVFITLPVGAAIFVNQLPRRWVLASFVVIFFTWLVRWIARGELTVYTPLNIPIALVLFMTGVALYPSVDPALTLPILAKTVAGFALFYAIVNTIRTERAFWFITVILFFTGISISAISLLNTSWNSAKLFTIPGIYNAFPRMLSILNRAGFNANIVGGTLGMLLPLCVATLIWIPRGNNFEIVGWFERLFSHNMLRLLVGLSTLVLGGVLILSQSRGAWVGVMLALVLIAVWRSRWMLVFVLLGTVGIFLIVQNFGMRAVLDFLLALDATHSSEGRFELWQRSIYMLQDFPFTGIGLGTFSRVVPILYPLFLIGPDAEVPHAHNLYFQTGVDLGVPGLVASMAIIAAFLLISTSAMRRSRGTSLECIAVGGMGGFVVYLVHGLVDDVTFSAKPAVVLWALMGLTTAVWLHLARHREHSDPETLY